METSFNLQKNKKRIIESIERTNDEALIRIIQNMIEYGKLRDEEYLGESVEEYNLVLEKADLKIDKGNFVTHEEAIKKIREWRGGK
jgi:predicted transcriptional regulator